MITPQGFEKLLKTAGFNDYKTGNKIAVAVSGGADSLALTLLLNQYAQKQSLHLVALTVDHGLRQESAQEALNLQALLKTRGIEHHILKWEGKKPTAALQEKARSKRYDLLESWCYDNNCASLFLGHHQGDQSETYCMRLRRHSTLMGLACMRAKSHHQRVTLLRPFLNIPKEKLTQTLEHFEVTWVEDPSNDNTGFERIFWRQSLCSGGPDPQPINLIPFQNVRTAYDQWITRYLEDHGTLSPLGYVRLCKPSFLLLPISFQEILLSYLLRAYGIGKYPLTSSSLTRALDKMKTSSFSALTACGLRLSKHQKEFLLVREYRAIKDEIAPEVLPKIWDKRFLINMDKTTKGTIKCVGEKGWLQLLKHTPNFKALDHPKMALWALPALWVGDEIDPTCNMIYEQFSRQILPPHKKRFIFRSKSPF